MKLSKASSPIRLFLLVVSIVIWLGIWLTGFDTAHWLLYVPAVFLFIAAVTGICPGLIISKTLLGNKS